MSTSPLPKELPIEFPTQSPEIDPQLVERFNELIEMIRNAKMPPLEEILRYLATIHPVYAGALVVIGFVYLIYGLRFTKPLMILNAAVAGAVAGGVGTIYFQYAQHWWIGMLVGAVVVGVLAWPLMTLFVSLAGGAAGAAVGYAVFSNVVVAMERTDLMAYSWAGAVGGAVLLAIAGFLLFRAAVVILTVVQGAAMMMVGVFSLLFLDEEVRDVISKNVMERPLLLLMCIGGLCMVGLAIQYFTGVTKQKTVKAAA
ncbi:MAG: hypothetical protein K8S55_00195 [Phycisphaerae bacterium]|nr:hypothetical protein [Phycisphaerae bacterium]